MRSKKQVMGGESGRSMLETLGVLAMMGLLAIGGIAGYRYAVDKYRSNELWNNVKWISVQVMTDGSLQGMSSGDEMTVKSFSGDSDLILKRETANGYSVRVGNLRESTCRQIRRDKPDWVEEVVSNEGAGCQDGEENEVKIYFNAQLNSETTDEGRYKRCEGDEECGACGRCSEEKICVNYDNLCQAPTPYCINGSCEPCPKGETLNSSGKCQACPVGENSTFRVTNDEAGAAACHKCGDSLIKASDGRCFSCDNASNSIGISNDESGQAECHRCSNRFWPNYSCTRCDMKGTMMWTPKEECATCPQRYWTVSDSRCHYCIGTPNEDHTSCNWDCPTGQFGADSNCYDCDDPTVSYGLSNIETCRKCKGVRFANIHSNCVRCDMKGTMMWTPKEECATCPQRYWTGGQCFLCPEKDSAEWQALSPTFQAQCSD